MDKPSNCILQFKYKLQLQYGSYSPRGCPYLSHYDSICKSPSPPVDQTETRDYISPTGGKERKSIRLRKCKNLTYISVSIPEDFVNQIAKLPAHNGVAGQRQVQDIRPEGRSSTLFMSSHDDICTTVKETPKYQCTVQRRYGHAIGVNCPTV